jgi:hypothetical protein
MAFAYPFIKLFGERDYSMGTLPFDPVLLFRGNYIDALGLISKAAWSYVGGYDHVRTGWEDYDLLPPNASLHCVGMSRPPLLARSL